MEMKKRLKQSSILLIGKPYFEYRENEFFRRIEVLNWQTKPMGCKIKVSMDNSQSRVAEN